MTLAPVRGRIYMAELGSLGEKPYLVVSNNARNSKLNDCLAVRLTTSKKPEMPSIVRLDHLDAMSGGCILCDDIVNIYKDELKRDVGAVSAATMAKVRIALMDALAL